MKNYTWSLLDEDKELRRQRFKENFTWTLLDEDKEGKTENITWALLYEDKEGRDWGVVVRRVLPAQVHAPRLKDK